MHISGEISDRRKKQRNVWWITGKGKKAKATEDPQYAYLYFRWMIEVIVNPASKCIKRREMLLNPLVGRTRPYFPKRLENNIKVGRTEKTEKNTSKKYQNIDWKKIFSECSSISVEGRYSKAHSAENRQITGIEK